MIDLFEYVDYRQYLRDVYEARKGENPLYSFQMMGNRLGMDPSYVAKVLAGQRHLPADKVEAAARLCGLAGGAAEYFECMVGLCRSRSGSSARIFQERMDRIRGVKSAAVSSMQAQYYSSWIYTVIRAAIGLQDWRDEYAAMASRLDPSLDPGEVEKAISFLLEHDLIRRDEAGILQPVDRHIRPGTKVDREAIRGFQKEMLELGKRSIDEHPPLIRDVSTLTMAIRSDSLPDIRKLIEECREAIRQRIDLDMDPDCIYQFNFQAFPLTTSPSVSGAKSGRKPQG
jgi:uncharacterized protein (TIGR02147 family)